MYLKYLLLTFLFPHVLLAQDIPGSFLTAEALYSFSILDIAPTDNVKKIDDAYRKMKAQAIKLERRDKNVFDLNGQSEILKEIEQSHKNIYKFLRNYREELKVMDHHFTNMSYAWVNKITPTDVEEYFSIVKDALTEKLQNQFGTYNPPAYDSDGPRANLKIITGKHYYIDYHKIMHAMESVGKEIDSIQAVDTFREIIILQIQTGFAFNYKWVDKFLAIKDEKILKVLESLSITISENENISSIDWQQHKSAEKRFLESFDWIEKFKDDLSFRKLEKLFSGVKLSRAIGMSIDFEYEVVEHLYYQIKEIGDPQKNTYAERASKELERFSRVLSKGDLRISQIFSGLFSPHVEEIQTSETLARFEKILWQSGKKARELGPMNDFLPVDEMKFIELRNDIEGELKGLRSCKGSMNNILR